MTVLVAGFHGAAADRLTRALTEAGYDAAGVGVALAPTLAAASKPEAVLVPAGAVGTAVRQAIEGVVPALRFFAVGPDAGPPLEALRGEPAKTPADDAPADPPPTSASPTVAPPSPAPQAEVVFQPLPEASPSPAPAPASPRAVFAPPEPGAGPTGARPSTGLAAKLAAKRAAKLEAVRFGDYHAVLEVKPSSPPSLVHERFEALRRAFEPTDWPVRLGTQELAELLEILSGLRDAHLVLGDDALRARYERALRQPMTRAHAPSQPTGSVPRGRIPG